MGCPSDGGSWPESGGPGSPSTPTVPFPEGPVRTTATKGDAVATTEASWSQFVEVRADAPAAETQLMDPTDSVSGPLFEQKTSDRYVDLGVIGEGGMGVVHRVLDRELNRTMAMKILRPELVVAESNVARFVEEAQATAQLQHPGIVPVHELGRLPDGRFYFTMAEVQGRTLEQVIQELHAASSRGRWEETDSGWTFRRLIAAFHQACTAVAYAHSRGVVHRDLKPSNIMVGSFGEVLVMDWGLAKILQSSAPTTSLEDEATVVTCRSQDEAAATRAGAIAGTPAYMAPEQARGDNVAIGPRTDVYALGAILYQVLAGTAPYTGTGVEVIAEVRQRPPPPPTMKVSRVASSGGTANTQVAQQLPLCVPGSILIFALPSIIGISTDVPNAASGKERCKS